VITPPPAEPPPTQPPTDPPRGAPRVPKPEPGKNPPDFRSRVCEAYLRDLPRMPVSSQAGWYRVRDGIGGGVFLTPEASVHTAKVAATGSATILGAVAFGLSLYGIPVTTEAWSSGATLFTFTRGADIAEKTMLAEDVVEWSVSHRAKPQVELEWVPWGDTTGCSP
jgi:hypothetical protein